MVSICSAAGQAGGLQMAWLPCAAAVEPEEPTEPWLEHSERRHMCENAHSMLMPASGV